MSDQRWRRIEELFTQAVELDPERRAEFLASACPDEELRREVSRLLAAHDSSGDFLETPPFRTVEGTTDPPATTPPTVGEYHVVRRLGAGGMGVVYEALQPGTERRVALKIVRTGAHLDPVAERLFKREIITLGRLDHPSIATIFEAGCTSDGVPYFVMELIEGQPLNEYLRTAQPSLDQRLRLFVRICRAVAYAHRRGVLHRDLKPSNVLVCSGNGGDALPDTPRVKILDFGLARLYDDTGQTTLLSDAGRVLGTLAYTSPEQARGDSAAVDTRSDVYSLGVILYEMLTGSLPHDVQGKPLSAAIRQICEKDPPRPRHLVPELDRDLEAVVLKALARDPESRYGSAADLADDVEKYLAGEPVSAVPPTAWRALKRTLWRYRWWVSAAAAVLVIAVGSGIWMGALYVRARRAEHEAAARLSEAQQARAEAERQSREARLEARRAAQVAEFLRYILSSGDPEQSGRHDVTVREVLDRAVKLLDRQTLMDPEARATLQDALGYSYYCLGQYQPAEKMLRAAWDWRRENLGPTHPNTLDSANNLAMLLTTTGQLEQAEEMFRRIAQADRERLGPDDLELVSTLSNLAYVQQALGHFDEAEHTLREVLRVRQAKLPADSPEIARTWTALSMLAGRAGRQAEAIELARRALAATREAFGHDHLQTAIAANNLAVALGQAGKTEEALELIQEALRIQKRILGEDHPDVATTLSNLSRICRQAGRLDEAERFARQALDIHVRTLGPNHPGTALSRLGLALAQATRGDREAAEASFAAAIAALKETLGEEHPDTRQALALYERFRRQTTTSRPASAPARPGADRSQTPSIRR